MAGLYNGQPFDTFLLAQWAAFFDLAGWEWSVSVSAVDNWKPDFRVCLPCTHSSCPIHHRLLVSVLEVSDLSSVSGHPALGYSNFDARSIHMAEDGALFGSNPSATTWQMSHASVRGLFAVPVWVSDSDQLWAQAATKVVRWNCPDLDISWLSPNPIAFRSRS